MKRLIAMLLALVMVFTLVACAPKAAEPEADADVDAPVEEPEAEEPAVEEPAEEEPEVEEPAEEEPEVEEPAEEEPEIEEPVEEEPVAEEPEAPSADAPAASGATVGQTLLKDFQDRISANPGATAQELAEGIIANPIIAFMGGAMPMEPGFFSGFDNIEITEFKEASMFAPMIGTIPFIGYIFTLAEGADVAAFTQMLSDNANLRWNICTEAEELVVESSGNTVFFLMCPASLEA